jgi:hypothetical protein
MFCFLSGFDHHAVPPGVHDPRAAEEGEEAEADLDRRGSDHINLHMAAEKGMMVVEVSGSIVTEDELMRILVMVRNFLPTQKQISEGWWNFRCELRL